MRFLIALCLLLLAGCSQNNLLAKQDYQKSQRDFLRGDDEEALLDYPRGRELDHPRGGEEGTFITSMEKGYLSLLLGKPRMAGLKKQAALQENQVRYHVSREARTFFYVQTPEDYYPSEHEVIWMHFLLSWGYAQQGKYEDACVEARVASSLLTLPWSPAGHFDDPTMRLFLAGLWTMCGEWREAQVDFRAAWAMDNSLAWARELAERDRPPAHLFIVLGGPGPDVLWDPALGANPLRSARQVSFKLRGRKSALSIADQKGTVIAPYRSPDAGKWYERHLARESELHEMILDSAYGANVTASGAKASATIAADTGLGVLKGMGTGALLGLVILGEAHVAPPKDVVVGTIVLGAFIGGIVGGIDGGMEGYRDSARNMKQELDPSIHYRFVRYLPEYLWMGWSDKDIAYPVQLSTPSASIEIQKPSVVNRTSVTVAHLPDAGNDSASQTGY